MNFGRVLSEATPLLLEGIKLTIGVSLIAIAIGILIGLLMCLMKMSSSKILNAIAGVYIWVIRGTPMLVQAFIVFFGFPQLIQMFAPGFRRFSAEESSLCLRVRVKLHARSDSQRERLCSR